MTDVTPDEVAAAVGKLTKAALRSIPKLSADWTLCSGTLRADTYTLWWGKLYNLHLVDPPRWQRSDNVYEMRLTPLGLAVRAHLQATSNA